MAAAQPELISQANVSLPPSPHPYPFPSLLLSFPSHPLIPLIGVSREGQWRRQRQPPPRCPEIQFNKKFPQFYFFCPEPSSGGLQQPFRGQKSPKRIECLLQDKFLATPISPLLIPRWPHGPTLNPAIGSLGSVVSSPACQGGRLAAKRVVVNFELINRATVLSLNYLKDHR